jgi:outer membrane biosynthesis protein TonB
MRVSQSGNTTKPSGNTVAALRAQIQAKPVKGVKLPNHKIKPPPPPPKQKKQKPQAAVPDKRDEAAERAERIAQQSHSTSLLKGKKVKTVYKDDRPKGGTWSFMIQLTFVIAVCGVGAYIAADPSVLDQIPWDQIKDKLKLYQFGIS